MMKKAFTLCGLFMALLATAAEVDTVVIRSEAMKRDIRCVVIKPSPKSGDTTRSWPAVYLLHGYDGSYNNWIRKVPDLKKYADELQLYIVCPDGGKSSWYFDSPVDPSM